MKKKNTVGFCYKCGKYTKHRVIKCEDTVAWRAFEIVCTLGFGTLLEHNYYCECNKCGEINELSF